jgi:hypothetical protein
MQPRRQKEMFSRPSVGHRSSSTSHAVRLPLAHRHNRSICASSIKTLPNAEQIPHNQAKYCNSSGMMAEHFENFSKSVLSAQLRWFSPTCPCGGEPRPSCRNLRSRPSNREKLSARPRSSRTKRGHSANPLKGHWRVQEITSR